jgi:cell division protein FtsA
VARRRPILAGLDIGTHKVAIVIAEQTDSGLEILGVGTALSRGMRAGRLVDVEKTTQDIGVALSEAELMAGCEIHQVTVSVSGDHLRGTNSHGVVAIDNGEVTSWAARRVIEAAQAVPLPTDQEILHLMCREFVVDGAGGIPDPVGLRGVRLEAHLHVISACESVLANLERCCHKAGLSVQQIIASSLASAEAVLDPAEKEVGVGLIDFGAGTVDIAIYHGGSVVHSAVLPMAGGFITHDLAQCLETSLREAESIKLRYGCADESTVDTHGYIEVTGMGGRPPRLVSRRFIAEIIQPRVEEIFEQVQQSIERSGYAERLTSGVVLAGGSSMMPGVVDVAASTIGLPARLGEPLGCSGLIEEIDDASWATAVGLARGLRSTDLGARRSQGWLPRVLPEWVWRRWRGYA